MAKRVKHLKTPGKTPSHPFLAWPYWPHAAVAVFGAAILANSVISASQTLASGIGCSIQGCTISNIKYDIAGIVISSLLIGIALARIVELNRWLKSQDDEE